MTQAFINFNFQFTPNATNRWSYKSGAEQAQLYNINIIKLPQKKTILYLGQLVVLPLRARLHGFNSQGVLLFIFYFILFGFTYRLFYKHYIL